MNERIRQLADKAGLKYHNWITNESNINDGDFKYPRLEDYEKFAELIVRDAVLSEREACAKVADRQNGDDEQDPESCVWSKAARHIAAAIRARGSE